MLKRFRFSANKLSKYSFLFILAVASSITVNFQLQGSSQTNELTIPTPDEALKQAQKLTPKELAQIEISKEVRNLLRFHPKWRPILEAIRQDIMTFRWLYDVDSGHIRTNFDDINLENPSWERYGAKVYPLLEYYTRSGDPIRQQYGMMGIRYLGKPYTTLWLTKHLQLKRTHLSFALYREVLEQEFGLDDPQTRRSLVALAKQHLESFETYKSFDYYAQLNYKFLTALNELDYISPAWQKNLEAIVANPEAEPSLQEWFQFERLSSVNDLALQNAVSYYQELPRNIQDYILLRRLGAVKAGEISQGSKLFLQKIASDEFSQDRVWAVAELNRHGDPYGKRFLQEIINGNLLGLKDLTTFYSNDANIRLGLHEDRYFASSMGGHVSFLLLGIAKEYPQSKFIQGCIEYAALRGMKNGSQSYLGFDNFGDRGISKSITNRPVQNWQQWLTRYPNHPGADDATFFLAKELQYAGDTIKAIDYWLKLMLEQPGDGDKLRNAWPYMRTLLDTGLSTEDLESLVKSQRNSDIVPLLQYSLAIRYAQQHRYADALHATESLDLKMPDHVLGSYYNSTVVTSGPSTVAKIQSDMQITLMEQRQRWTKLKRLLETDNPENQYLVASNWSSSEGWKNGYLPIWDNYRTWRLPRLSPLSCQAYWVCNLDRRHPDAVTASYQQSSQNSIVLSLYQDLLKNPDTPAYIYEKTLYMIASTLFAQWDLHPIEETISIHPPPGVSGESQLQKIWKASQPFPALYDPYNLSENHFENYREFRKRLLEAERYSYKEIKKDYLIRIDEIIAELTITFPESPYIDDLMLSSYFFSNKSSYLQSIVELYSDGDRFVEAAFLLNQITSSH